MNLDDLLKLANRPPRIEPVQIDTETVYVRGLSAGDMDEVAQFTGDDTGPAQRLLIVAKALCDEKGNPLCGDIQEHARRLSGLPEWTVKRLYLAADMASDVKPGELEGLLGNSGERADGGNTDSPSKPVAAAS